MLRKVCERLGVDQVLFVIVVVVVVVVVIVDVARLSTRPVLVDGRAAVGVGVEMDVGALHLKFSIVLTARQRANQGANCQGTSSRLYRKFTFCHVT